MQSRRLSWLVVASMLAAVPACGGGGAAGDVDASVATVDANVPSDFTELIGRDWTITPGETYECVRIRVDRDMYINGFHADSPLGTHHTVLTVSTRSTPLGDYDCNAGNLDLQMLFASGVGTDDLAFPPGVAMKVNAGEYLNLNIHLFDTQPSGSISGHTGVWIKEIPAADVENEAEMVFAGQGSFTIPGETGATPFAVHGGCAFHNPATILAYWPHMHQYAVHQKVTFTVDGAATVLDHDYAFTDQKNYLLATPIVIDGDAGGADSIDVECDYENHTGTPVSFGDSSEAEMCFTGLYRYPKQALYLFECTENFGG